MTETTPCACGKPTCESAACHLQYALWRNKGFWPTDQEFSTERFAQMAAIREQPCPRFYQTERRRLRQLLPQMAVGISIVAVLVWAANHG